MTLDANKVREAIATLERARDDAVENIAGGNPSFIKQLEEAVKGIEVLRSLL